MSEIVKIAQLIFYFSSISAAIFAYINVKKQLLHSKQIAKVQFLSDLQKEWQKSHSSLANDFLGTGIFSNDQICDENKRNDKHFEVRNYLHFFELIAIALKNDAIDLDQVDDLFGHRFSRLYNNNWVKKNMLENHEYYDGYKMLRELSEKWIKHRQTLERPINFNPLSQPNNKQMESG